jgi:hypothetical protein
MGALDKKLLIAEKIRIAKDLKIISRKKRNVSV